MRQQQENFFTEEAIALARTWLIDAQSQVTKEEEEVTRRLNQLIDDPDGLTFAMEFIDRAARPKSRVVAAQQIKALSKGSLPSFLSFSDQMLMKLGGRLASKMPNTVVPLARKRMRQIVGDLVIEAEKAKLVSKLKSFRQDGFKQNVNLLGEAVLGENEAKKRFQATVDLLHNPDVDYVSVKLSAIASQLNYWDFEGSLDRVTTLLYSLFSEAKKSDPLTFINLDMEEYHDLEFTVEAFRRVLDAPEFRSMEAGIVLQAYLPDSYDALRGLVAWATKRKINGGGEIKIRLVKGANLAMEKVEASLKGWKQAPYLTKLEVDANYKRCIDWVFTKDRTIGVRLGIASHNVFDIAWAFLVAEDRQVRHKVQFEMLHGMAPSQSRVVQAAAGNDLLLYTPIVAKKDFDVAIGYLFRRLEENANPGNFLRSLLTLEPNSELFDEEAERFNKAVEQRWQVNALPNRQQPRPAVAAHGAHFSEFRNEPDSDPSLAANRFWMHQSIATRIQQNINWFETVASAEAEVVTARVAQKKWCKTSLAERRDLLHGVANQLAQYRGDFLALMAQEAKKTCDQADTEISEAIDFARYYGYQALDLEKRKDVYLEPFGVVTIASPWNFPVAIAVGGICAALAAGNAVVLKPSPETPRCAQLIAECFWQAGVDRELLRFVPIPDGEASKTLIVDADAVVLTGSLETAQMFQSWKPDIKLFAETSGKNALIVTPSADIDLAVADIVASAFGHAGQKCSAASLVIGVGDITNSESFRNQLQDAVESLSVGHAETIGSDLAHSVLPVRGHLERALTRLDDGESWLVEPKAVDASGRLWSPGVRLGVQQGSWFQQTECFGPVLGIIETENLETAIEIQNSTNFGLTGGIWSLDTSEVETWLENVQVGNAYVNRSITGAIVQRQPFGGWKKSVIGPGAKAGGPNYVQQFGVWKPTSKITSDDFLVQAKQSDAVAWADTFSLEHDPTGLFCESNILKYLPLEAVALWVGDGADQKEIDRVQNAAAVCTVPVVQSEPHERAADFIKRLAEQKVERIRSIGKADPLLREWALQEHIHLADNPVTADGSTELLFYLREQSISQTKHRFGYISE